MPSKYFVFSLVSGIVLGVLAIFTFVLISVDEIDAPTANLNLPEAKVPREIAFHLQSPLFLSAASFFASSVICLTVRFPFRFLSHLFNHLPHYCLL